MRDIKRKKARIFFYSGCILMAILYILLYIDFNRYHNFTKIRYSYYPNYSVDGFGNIVSTIQGDNMLNARLKIKNNKTYLSLKNFNDVLLDETNKEILGKDQLHPTQRLALFSMGYLYDYFMESYHSSNLNKLVVEEIEDTYLFVHQEINNPFSANVFTINDHAISERVQFLVVFNSYIVENYPEKKELLNALSKDINLCYNLLRDRDFFTWQTNHGIMQLRSLAQLITITKNIDLKKELIKEFETRLSDLIPYVIGEDGAVYESATGYWYYIYNQFSKIGNISDIQDLKSVKVLNSRLANTKLFLNYLSSPDYYIEGIGDSYPFYLNPDDTLELNENRFFDFSNKISGANWSFNDTNVNVLYSSLYTPPNVHKQPDDLMFSLYVNSPFFSNTGIYSYDYSQERIYFRNDENAHSSVSIQNEKIKKSDSSFTKLNTYDTINSKATLYGEKYYSNGQIVSRKINIDPKINSITIEDSASPRIEIKSSFNINPNTKIERMTMKEYILINEDSIKVKLTSNNDINVTTGIISTQKEKIDTIQRLEIIGTNLITTLSFEPPNEKLEEFTVYDSNFSSDMRSKRSEILEEKYYARPTWGLKAKLLLQLFLIVIVFVIVAVLFEKKLVKDTSPKTYSSLK